MAVGKSVFEIAAVEREKVDDASTALLNEDVAEIRLGEHTYVLVRKPTAAQYTTMQIRLMRGGDQQFRGLDRFMSALILDTDKVLIEGRLDPDGKSYVQRAKDGDRFVGMDFLWELFEEDQIDEDDLVGILTAAIDVHSGFPTESASASSPGPTPSGTTSTAASRRNTSTRSTSR